MPRLKINEPTNAATSDEMIDAIAEFYDDPLGFVYFAFPWGEAGTELHDQDGPDAWQIEMLTKLGEAVRARTADVDGLMGAYMAAVASGHGVGKSAGLSWVILWFMSCRVDPAIVVTANTAGQLSGKTWREIAKWLRLMIHGSWFQWTATKLYLKARPETHFAAAVPWSKERSEGFAGLHARHVLVIFDEGSAIDDSIWEVTEGAMTTSGAIWLVFGNPTKNTGRFRECWRRWRHRWDTLKVDSRTAKKANRGQIDKWIEDYGEDSDFARIRVRGEFPRSASTQLISGDLIETAQRMFKARFADRVKKALALGPGGLEGFQLTDNRLSPLLMMVDVARFGADQSVIGLRQGNTFIVLAKYREMDTMQLAARVAEWINELQPDAIFVDGVGVGGGVVDALRALGYEIEDTNAGMKALNETKFFNRRAEMWWAVREWLAKGGMIPHDDKELMDDLTTPEYGFSDRNNRVQLESKDDMKARGFPSPDTADCLAMSFWMPVAPRASMTSVAEKIAAAARGQNGASSNGTWQSH
jgi:hypothetical protein